MKKPLILAHRGYSGKFPENTLRAFREALALKTPAIELDVHLAKDQALVVTHDFKLGRCVKGPANSTLSDFTSQELAQFDAGSFKGTEFQSERVSRLETVLSLIDHQCLLNIEIKRETLVNPEAYDLMVEKLLNALKSYGLKDIVFSSFDPYVLKLLRKRSPEARIALLDDCAEAGPRIAEARELSAEFYNVNIKRVSRETVARLQEAGFKVLAYTVKNQGDLVLAQGLQLDGLFADNLEEALQ